MKKALLVLLLLGLFALPAQAWQGRLVQVADGDTFEIERLDDGTVYRIRAYGIDCPELNQPWGPEALAGARRLLDGAEIGVAGLYLDNYDRLIAILINQDTGQVLQEELVSGGLCWVYDHFCTDCELWQHLQTRAKRDKVGLWADRNPLAPWDWRRSHPRR